MLTASCSSDTETTLESEEQVESNKRAAISEPKDALNGYIDVNDDPELNFVKYLQIADSGDEEKLLTISEEYREEEDTFKRQDLAKNLLPEINKKINEYRNGYHVKIPIASEPGVYRERKGHDEQYDFTVISGDDFKFHAYIPEKKAFVSQLCNSYGFILDIEGVHSDEDRFYTSFDVSPFDIYPKSLTYFETEIGPLCGIAVTDETIARKIEDARANNLLEVEGYGYFDLFVDQAEDKLLTPVLLDVTYYNRETNENLLTKKLTF